MRCFMIAMAITVHKIWNDICWWFTASWKNDWYPCFRREKFDKSFRCWPKFSISSHLFSTLKFTRNDGVFQNSRKLKGQMDMLVYDMTPSWNHLPPWIASKHQWFSIRMAPVALYTPYLVVSFSKNSNNTIKLDSTALHLPPHSWNPQMLPQHDSQPLQLPNSINP